MILRCEPWFWSVTAAPWLAFFIFVLMVGLDYARLPEQVPYRFTFDGEACQWVAKSIWAALSPLTLLLLILILVDAPSQMRTHTWLLTYWAIYGLMLGIFLAIRQAARTGTRRVFRIMLLSAALIPAAEVMLCHSLRVW